MKWVREISHVNALFSLAHGPWPWRAIGTQRDRGVWPAVYYFVQANDGQRYGPADVDTLVAWVMEGRIVAGTVLIERGTDRPVSADSLPALAAALRRVPASGGGPAAPAAPHVVSVERGMDVTLTSAGHKHPHAGFGTPVHRGPANTLPPIPTHLPQGVMMPYGPAYGLSRKSKIASGLLGIFLGCLGVHRFYLGYTGWGFVQLCLTLLTCGYGTAITGPWGLIEGILCLTGSMRDADGLELRD